MHLEKSLPTCERIGRKKTESLKLGFKLNGKSMSALFTADGVMTESEVAINAAQFPCPTMADSFLKSLYISSN